MVGAGTRKARAISSVDSPPSVRSVSATCASIASAGWQHVKIRRSRSSGTGASSSFGGPTARDAARSRPASARGARAGAAGRSPCAARWRPASHRIRRRAGHRPLLERRRERLLERLLGHVEVAEQTDQRGQDPPVLRSKDLLDAHGRLMVTLPHQATACDPFTDGDPPSIASRTSRRAIDTARPDWPGDDVRADGAKMGGDSVNCPSCRSREPRRGEVLQRLRCAPGGAGDHPRAALLHAAPPRREDPRLQERARGRAQAGHRPLRRRRALDGARRARRSRGVASPPRSPLPDPRGRRPPLRGDHQPVHRRRHHGALRRPDRARGPRPARLRGRARDGARARGARRATCGARPGSISRCGWASTRARSSSGESATTCAWTTPRRVTSSGSPPGCSSWRHRAASA